MEKFQITQGNDIITIGDVVLTKDAIMTLDNLQEDKNSYINEFLEALGSAVCFFAKTQFDFGRDYQTEAQSLIAKLSFIHSDLRYLKSTPPEDAYIVSE